MIILNSTLKSLEVKLAGVITTTQLPYTVSYVDVSQTTFGVTAADETDGTTNSTSVVTMLSAPGATTSRQVKFLSIYNSDTVSATVTVQINNNGTTRILWKGALAVGDTLQYVG